MTRVRLPAGFMRVCGRGTGVVGRHVVAALDEAGHEPVMLTRSAGIDLEAGAGLDAALVDVTAVVDTSNVLTLSRRRSVAFFTAATGNLLAAGARAGMAHHLALSIVGVDRVDFGYYEGKRRQEELDVVGMVRQVVRRRATLRVVLPARVPGSAGRAMAEGGLLPIGAGPRGRQTFAEWLATA